MAERGDAYLQRRGKVTPSGRRTRPENWSNLLHMSTAGEGHGDQKSRETRLERTRNKQQQNGREGRDQTQVTASTCWINASVVWRLWFYFSLSSGLKLTRRRKWDKVGRAVGSTCSFFFFQGGAWTEFQRSFQIVLRLDFCSNLASVEPETPDTRQQKLPGLGTDVLAWLYNVDFAAKKKKKLF